MSLFEELKRRRVLRLVAAYVVVAWVLIQVVTAIEEPLNLPGWFDTAVIVLLGLGFPIAIIMSWVYDVTPDGFVREDGTRVRLTGIDYGKVALGAVIFLGAFLAGNYLTDSTGSSSRPIGVDDSLPLRRIQFPMSGGFTYDQFQSMTLEITPDGNTFVYRVLIDGRGHLVSRRLDELDFQLVEGGQNARWIYALSPDGDTVVFQDEVDNQLKKVPVAGGPALAFHDPQGPVMDMAWSSTGTIVYGTTNHHGLYRVPETGGEREVLSSADLGIDHKHPEFLPGSDMLLITVGSRSLLPNPDDSLAFLTDEGELIETGVHGSAPTVTGDGSLIYFSQDALWTAQLDSSALSISRDPVAIVGNMEYAWNGIYGASDNGMLVHRAHRLRAENQVVIVARDGTEHPVPIPIGLYGDVSPSPDGRLFAVGESTNYGSDLVIRSIDGSESWRVTNDVTLERAPTWTRDGRHLYFSAGPRDDLFRYDVVARGTPERLTRTQSTQMVRSVSADGQKLFITETSDSSMGRFLAEYEIGPEAVTRKLSNEASNEFRPSLSPDGKWLAYSSDRSGLAELYVRPYPDLSNGILKVSNGGGQQPVWNADGTELFYWSETHVMAAPITRNDQGELNIGTPVPLFEHSRYQLDNASEYFLVPDSFMFVKNPADGGPTVDEFVMIQNWPALIETRAD
jgi:serine/threonine-protein kinase